MRYVCDRDAAQDVLHDGFVKIFANLHKLKSADSLKSWMSSIMVNTAINTLRHRHATDSLDEMEESQIPVVLEDDAFDRYTVEQILSVLQTLPDVHRAVFNLYAVEGYPAEEVADRFCLKPVTVRSIAFRVRKQLMELLENEN